MIKNKAINKLLAKRWLLATIWLALADRKYPSRFEISAACRKWELEVGDYLDSWDEEDTMQILAFFIKLNEDDRCIKYDLEKVNLFASDGFPAFIYCKATL